MTEPSPPAARSGRPGGAGIPAPQTSQGLLSWAAGGSELIDAQYAGRPHLRPVLGAVLAALPALGPVTIQARKTFVSLVTPRRTFAVVQATKARVDLGLRLEDTAPHGRLRAARDLGAATVRIPSTAPPTSMTRCSAGCAPPTRRTRHHPLRAGAPRRGRGRIPAR